jgi:ribose 5-phosphate isomerase B
MTANKSMLAKGGEQMIAVGSDHGGLELKNAVVKHLGETGVPFRDFGTYTPGSCDYPLMAKAPCEAVLSGECEKALLFCGTGIGISMAANKHRGIRAAVCSDTYSARYTRLHNDANVLCLGARVAAPGLACELVDVFLSTGYEGGRHQRRVDQLADIENER